jgi:hypothetical protein
MMGHGEIVQGAESLPEKAKEVTGIAVDKVVGTTTKRESGSTASAIKSFIAGILFCEFN